MHLPGGRGIPDGLARPELEALRWVVRMNSGEAGPAAQAELADWCARAPENRPALAAACRLWLATGPALRAVGKAPALPQWPRLALAAALLLCLSLGYRTLIERGAAVPAAGVAQLADAGGYCRLLLGEGNAAFDVTPDPGRRAGAGADETRVRVMDAAFSLKPYAAGVLVTVTGGRVGYRDGGGLHVVAAGQQMRCNAGHPVAADAAPLRKAHHSPRPGIQTLLTRLSEAWSGSAMQRRLRHMLLPHSI